MPTDTVYGVAARPDVPGAIEAIFHVKGRPEDRPLPILAAAPADLDAVAVLDGRAALVAQRFWPGGLTLVLPRARGFDVWLGGTGEATVAVRIPACEVALGVLRRAGPLAVTSANRSGQPPATTVEEARRALPGVQVFVDGGPRHGAPSTIVSLVGEPQILRAGAIPREEVLAVLG